MTKVQFSLTMHFNYGLSAAVLQVFFILRARLTDRAAPIWDIADEGGWIHSSKICYFGKRQLRIYKKSSLPSPICLKAEHKFRKASLLPPLSGRTSINPWRGLWTLIYGEDIDLNLHDKPSNLPCFSWSPLHPWLAPHLFFAFS